MFRVYCQTYNNYQTYIGVFTSLEDAQKALVARSSKTKLPLGDYFIEENLTKTKTYKVKAEEKKIIEYSTYELPEG